VTVLKTESAPHTTAISTTQRIDSIDALRGLVIVLMVVDHAREYSAGTGRVSDPMALDSVTPLLFWMRWAAHFCAPVFTLLAGVSAGLQADRLNKSSAARYLITRGVVLVLLEFTVIWFAWTFSFVWPMFYAQVIWGLGISLIVLGLLQPIPPALRVIIGAVCVVGHNALDGWHPKDPAALHWIWAILHDRQVLPLWSDLTVRTSYPVLPMIGLAVVGESLGRWYRRTPAQRDRTLRTAGVACIVCFLLLRISNVYGDPHAASYSGELGLDLLAMLNTTKYPMSLSFVLMTLGPALLLLAAWDRGVPRVLSPFVLLGQVPMFIYIAHLYALHAAALAWALLAGYAWSAFDFRKQIAGMPDGFGFPLWITIPFAIATVVSLLPAARWYARLRASKRFAVTRYV
jgi:uncharacterized membrane protein